MTSPPPPEGFNLRPTGDGGMVITYKRTGMGCMNAFLMAWLAGWTATCLFVLNSYLNGGTLESGSPMPIWFVLAFWLGEVIVIALLAYLMFCKKIYFITWEGLTVETNVLGLRWRKSFTKPMIKRFFQVQDGGDDDSFPSWGLTVEAGKCGNLLYRQPYEKSLWLGRILAEWAGVAFDECLDENAQEARQQP